jgi:hypothetical protein
MEAAGRGSNMPNTLQSTQEKSMGTPDVMVQYKLFHKYYDSAYENGNLRDYQTAEQLRGKIVPQMEAMLNEENLKELGGILEMFTEFVYEYFLCLSRNDQRDPHVESALKSMADKVIKLNSSSFWGHYFMTVHHSFNLSSATAGSGPAVYKGRDAASTIVGTAFTLLGKGLTLGVTATAAGISKSNFTSSAGRVVELYRSTFASPSVSVVKFIKMTTRMFDLAEFCEGANISTWKEVYKVVKQVDTGSLDYSELDEQAADEARERAMELVILADSKV